MKESESVSCSVRLFVTPWTVALQGPLSIGFPRQEYWGGLSFSSPGDLSDPGMEPASLKSSASAVGFFTTSVTWEAAMNVYIRKNSLNYTLKNNAHLYLCSILQKKKGQKITFIQNSKMRE